MPFLLSYVLHCFLLGHVRHHRGLLGCLYHFFLFLHLFVVYMLSNSLLFVLYYFISIER
jgi:hypothetical protein